MAIVSISMAIVSISLALVSICMALVRIATAHRRALGQRRDGDLDRNQGRSPLTRLAELLLAQAPGLTRCPLAPLIRGAPGLPILLDAPLQGVGGEREAPVERSK